MYVFCQIADNDSKRCIIGNADGPIHHIAANNEPFEFFQHQTFSPMICDTRQADGTIACYPFRLPHIEDSKTSAERISPDSKVREQSKRCYQYPQLEQPGHNRQHLPDLITNCPHRQNRYYENKLCHHNKSSGLIGRSGRLIIGAKLVARSLVFGYRGHRRCRTVR